MMIFKDIVKFILCVFIIFYGPGHFLISCLKKECEFWEKSVLSFCVGIFLIPQIYYYLESIKLHNMFLGLVLISSSIYCIRLLTKFNFNIKFSIEKIFMVGIILVTLFITGLIVCPSGLMYDNGMRFYQANAYDSVAQMAMVNELVKDPPHEFPFYSGLSLRGYHIGSFYWRAIVQKITHINNIDLFFRYCPIFLFPLLILMFFLTIKNILKSQHVALVAIFFVFLMGDLSWIFPMLDRLTPGHEIRTVYFMGNLFDWLLFNPPLVQGILMLSLGCYFLNYCDKKQNDRQLWFCIVFIGILFGSLFEYKAFIWATVLPALVLVGVKEYLINKKSLFFKVAIVAAVFSALSYFRISSHQLLTLFKLNIGHYPLSLFREMGILNSQIEPTFFIVLLAFLFYLLGGLGIKVIGFYTMYWHLKDWISAKATILFFIFSLAFSFVFTHMFLLSSNYFYATYNFFAVFLLVISIFSAETIMLWVRKLTASLRMAIFLTIFTVGIGSTIFSFLAYFPEYAKYKVVSEEELSAMNYLKMNLPQNAVILTRAIDRDWISQKGHAKLIGGANDRDSFISAITSRRTVLECSWHMEIGSYAPDLMKRKEDVNIFFMTNDTKKAKDILDKYSVSYIWVDRNKDLNFQKYGVLENFFSNQAVIIYKALR